MNPFQTLLQTKWSTFTFFFSLSSLSFLFQLCVMQKVATIDSFLFCIHKAYKKQKNRCIYVFENTNKIERYRIYEKNIIYIIQTETVFIRSGSHAADTTNRILLMYFVWFCFPVHYTSFPVYRFCKTETVFEVKQLQKQSAAAYQWLLFVFRIGAVVKPVGRII